MDIQEIFDKIGFDFKMAIFNMVNFLVFFFILHKFVFGKIAKIIEERNNKIETGLKDAEAAKQAKNHAEETALDIVREASEKANTIIAESKSSANKEVSEIKDKAQIEIKDMKDRAKKQLETEKQEVMGEIKEKTADLAIQATEKIIGEKINDKKDKEIINDYLNKIDPNV
ncbi:MAG: F0F1 ATP synthase subunit B [Candidatus Dojkabacteria bacterium]|nr:F0F1 ATP synthase subunit B [Candidatus Dojkabacteria bacterium]MDQ7020937.1 F0F1 ATP synthase subunit B [Candidatus Dojkabacteria bacterium]